MNANVSSASRALVIVTNNRIRPIVGCAVLHSQNYVQYKLIFDVNNYIEPITRTPEVRVQIHVSCDWHMICVSGAEHSFLMDIDSSFILHLKCLREISTHQRSSQVFQYSISVVPRYDYRCYRKGYKFKPPSISRGAVASSVSR